MFKIKLEEERGCRKLLKKKQHVKKCLYFIEALREKDFEEITESLNILESLEHVAMFCFVFLFYCCGLKLQVATSSSSLFKKIKIFIF